MGRIPVANFSQGLGRYHSTSSVPLLIKGKEVFDSSSVYKVYSQKNEHLHDVSALSTSDADLQSIAGICKDSLDAFNSWRSIPQTEKHAIYGEIERELSVVKDEIISAHLEIGVPEWFANVNYNGAIAQLKHYQALLLTKPAGSLPVQNYSNANPVNTELSLVINQPLGPVLSISPWNAPGILAARSILAPLTAGCSVIHKSSHLSPRVSYLIANAFRKAGLPPNTVQMINTNSEDSEIVIEAMISDPAVRKVNFTGSTKVGAKVSSVAGKYLKPVLLELGGKNVSLITPEAELHSAIKSSIWSSWCHKGQICMVTDLIFVHESIYDKSMDLIKNTAKEFLKHDQDLIINQRTISHRDSICDLVDDALSKGARIISGIYDPTIRSTNTPQLSPIVLSNVDKSMKVFGTESFGPLVSIIKYSDLDLAIKDINELNYGLKFSVWSQNHLDAYKIAQRVESGSVHINHPTLLDDPHLPHGGVKLSGMGRFNADWGIDEFQYPKLITFN